MNEIEKTLQKILERSLEVAEKTGQFAIDQAPEILEQFFKWHLASHVMGVVLCIIALMVSGIVIKYGTTKKAYDSDIDILFFILGGFGVVISSGFLCMNVYYMAYIFIAPKIYLIEYFIK